MKKDDKRNILLEAEEKVTQKLENTKNRDALINLFGDKKLIEMIDDYFFDQTKVTINELKKLTSHKQLRLIIANRLIETDKFNLSNDSNNKSDKLSVLTPEEEIQYFLELEKIKYKIRNIPEVKKRIKKLEESMSEDDLNNELINIYNEFEEYINQKNKIAERNIGLSRSIAKKYKERAKLMDENDLINEGIIGLLTAIDKFDINKNNKFSTYATWWIRQKIIVGLGDTDKLIRVPIHTGEIVDKLIEIHNQIEIETGNEKPNIDEIKNRYEKKTGQEISEKRIIELLLVVMSPASLDMNSKEEKDFSLYDVIENKNIKGPQNETDHSELTQLLKEAFDEALTENEAIVLIRRFNLHGKGVETLETIGKDLHVTRERVRQIEESGLSKLRNPKVSKIFEGHHKNAGQEISGTSNKKAKKKVKK